MHHTIATAPGGALQLLRPGDELEVDDSHTSIQRALRNGDLVRVANPRARPPDERFSPAMVTLTVGGPPAAFGNLPPLDPSTPGRVPEGELTDDGEHRHLDVAAPPADVPRA